MNIELTDKEKVKNKNAAQQDFIDNIIRITTHIQILFNYQNYAVKVFSY